MADSTIPNLPAFTGNPTGVEVLETVQSGASVKIASQAIADLATIVTPITKAALISLGGLNQISVYKLYLITNATAGRLLVKGETTSTLEDGVLNMSTGQSGTYVLGADTFTAAASGGNANNDFEIQNTLTSNHGDRLPDGMSLNMDGGRFLFGNFGAADTVTHYTESIGSLRLVGGSNLVYSFISGAASGSTATLNLTTLASRHAGATLLFNDTSGTNNIRFTTTTPTLTHAGNTTTASNSSATTTEALSACAQIHGCSDCTAATACVWCPTARLSNDSAAGAQAILSLA